MRTMSLFVCGAVLALCATTQVFAQEADPNTDKDVTAQEPVTNQETDSDSFDTPDHVAVSESPEKTHGLEEASEFSLMDLKCPFFEDLREKGISFGLGYTADFFSNTRGGLSTNGAFQYRGFLDFSISLDTERLGLWKGGTFFIDFYNFTGVDISERYVGDIQFLNNNDSPNDSKVFEYWYQQTLFEDRVRVKLGKMDVNNDFAAGVYRDEFINTSALVSPTIPMVTWPDTGLGILVFVEPVDWFYCGAGVYDALGKSTRIGFDTAFHAPQDSFTIVELGFRPKISLFGQEDLPGQYSIGGFYHSGTWETYFNDLGGRLSPRYETGNTGFYLTFDQFVYREEASDDSETEQGLGLFFQYGWAPPDRNEITEHFGGGFQYYGPIPTRDEDVVGLGLQHVNLNPEIQKLENRYSETAIELFYKAKVTNWLTCKPDIQYIVNPGGDGRDALVAGIRLEFSLL